MRTKHMFTIEITAKGFRTHVVEDTGEILEISGSKRDFKNIEVFETHLATSYPHFQVPMDRKLINGFDYIKPIIAEGPLGNDLKEDSIEAQPNTVLSADIFNAPTQEEIDQAEALLYLHNLEKDSTEEAFNLESEVDTIDFNNKAPEPIYQEKISINPLKQEKMETNTTVENQPQAKPEVTKLERVSFYSKHLIGHTSRAITGPTHFALQSIADIAQAAADKVADLEAWNIDKLEIAVETREEIRQAVKNRTRLYQSYATAPIKAVKFAGQMLHTAATSTIKVEPA